MKKDDDMKVLADLAESMHKVAEGLETMAIYLLRDVTEAAQSVPEPQPAAPQVTYWRRRVQPGIQPRCAGSCRTMVPRSCQR